MVVAPSLTPDELQSSAIDLTANAYVVAPSLTPDELQYRC